MDEYFAGRAAELALLDGLLRRAAAGRGQLAVILGPGWIGKTALIQQFLDDREARVRWVGADRDETGLPGGLLEQFGIAAAGYGGDPLRAGSALLAKLRQWAGEPEAAAEASGVPGAVLVVDDAQWGDPLSLQALSYALRRLPDTPLLTLLAVRDDAFGCLPPGLVRLISDRGTRLEVAGLGVAEISSLAERVGAGPVPPRAALRLLEHTGGVPQYVREVLQAVPRESLRTALSAPDLLLPSPKSLEARVLTALAGCSGPARRLVAAAAVLGARCRLADAAALADLADPLPALEEAIGAGLLAEAPALDGRCCKFPHASVRAAVYGCVGVAERATLHRQAARGAVGARALAHRVAACGGTDTALARELTQHADADRAAGRLPQASDLYLAALRVAARGAERDRLLQTAAGLLLDLGEAAAAGGLAGEIAATAPSAARSLLLGRLAIAARDPRSARRWLTDASLDGTWRADGARADGEPAVSEEDASAAAGEFALLLLATGRRTEAAAWARRATATAGASVTRALAQVIAAECLARDGQPEQALTALRAELGRQDLDDSGAPVLRAGLGTILFWCDELPAAAGHLAAAEAAQDASPAAGASPVPFQARRQLLAASVQGALADYRIGAWDEAADQAERLVTLAADLDQDSLLCGAHAAAVYPAVARGRWDTARAHASAAARYAAAGDRDQLLAVAGARVALAFAMDDPEAVLAAARPVVVELAGVADGANGLADLAGFAGAEPALLSFWPLYAHALARVGRLAEAADALTPFAELASARGRRSAIAAAARVEGFIHAAAGRPDAARRAYQVALAGLDGLCMPHEEALTRLDYGRFLRHQSQRRAALRELYAARAAFARLGAVPFLARCDAELGHEVPTVPMVPSVPAEPAATSATNAQLSDSAVRAAPTWPAPLTARQLAVAEAVAEGKSNRQVARELYITVKTVEYHVSQIFAKLGIDGRADVAGVLQSRKS